MKILFLAAALTAFSLPALAQHDPFFAMYSEESGSLPPEDAWLYRVRFRASGIVEVDYCKGNAIDPPGCATVKKRISEALRDELRAELEPFKAQLVENRPQHAPNDEIPIGGSSIRGWVLVGKIFVDLPAFAAKKDAQRVREIQGIIQKYIPQKLVKKAKRRAKQP